MKTGYITHPDFLKHKMIEGHPEQPARLLAIQDQLQAHHLGDFLQYFEPQDVSKEMLLRVHTEGHIEYVFKNAPLAGQALFHVDPDTFMNEHTLNAALKAAGAGVMAVDLIMAKNIDNAFCAVRPPGHHAERNRAMGFCFFNNIAVAAAHALEKHKLERVAIVDFDVHHGNGTEDIFENDPRVMVCSTYGHPLYPYSGRPSVPGHLINCPLKQGSAGPEFRRAVQEEWLPALEAFQPQFIFISAGFDAHWQDDMANLQLNEQDYGWVTQKMRQLANKYAAGRIVSMLEGGYALGALGRSVTQHLRALMGLD
jgi:acetoin utilization deacetylase AcuC-like enzyme